MIVTLAKTPTQTERVWTGLRSKRLPSEIQGRALDKLRLLNRAKTLKTCETLRATASTN